MLRNLSKIQKVIYLFKASKTKNKSINIKQNGKLIKTISKKKIDRKKIENGKIFFKRNSF